MRLLALLPAVALAAAASSAPLSRLSRPKPHPLAMSDATKKQVLVPIADGSEEIEAVGVIDTLVRAGARVTVASVMGGPTVTCSRGVKLVADAMIGDVVDKLFDAIVLPGGMPGAEHLASSEPLAALLKAQAASGRLTAAICAAPVVVLQKHGLLEGKKATAHPAFSDKLVDQAPVPSRVVVRARRAPARTCRAASRARPPLSRSPVPRSARSAGGRQPRHEPRAGQRARVCARAGGAAVRRGEGAGGRGADGHARRLSPPRVA